MERTALSSPLQRAADAIGAHRHPQLLQHERDRALQRAVIGIGLVVLWCIRALFSLPVPPPGFIVLGLIYGLGGALYRRSLRPETTVGLVPLYAFLLLDPAFLVGVLYFDADSLAFLNPFVLVLVVTVGIRYGWRTMVMAWAAAAAASTALVSSSFWNDNIELGLSYLLMIGLGPLLFTSLVRRIHAVRALEEQRARIDASQDLALARSAFLAKVSHELRSPLQGIVSALDVIEMRHARAFEDDAELIGRMRRSSMLLNTQLRDLLTLAKGEAGRLQVHAEPFEACSLLEALAESARELAVSKGLELVVDIPPGPLFAVGDAARIDQVLTNLVINSIRYTDHGQVRIGLTAIGEPLEALQFMVADTGPGIPDDVLPNLFEPDRHLGGGARRGEGSGIGLAIVRTLIDHLDGKLSVSSTVDRGTLFTVVVPATPAADEPRDFADTDTHGRVLIVDDRSDVRDALESVVDDLGYELDLAGSAATAARLLRERSYDAVLLDLDMPTRGGAELLAEIRLGTGPNRRAHFICISARGAESPRDALFDASLVKPIELAALRRALLAARPGATPAQARLWSMR